MAKQRRRQQQKLIPIGDTSALTQVQLERVQIYAIAKRLIPSGNCTARNVEALAQWLAGEAT